MKLIALTGLHGAGKDTVADALPARKLAFADVLYREVARSYSLDGLGVLKCRETKEAPQNGLALMWVADEDEDFLDFLAVQNGGSISISDPRSPRQILQWWGDYRRAQDPDYFLDALDEEVFTCELNGTNVVITDCRFPNEARMVRQLGGQIWQVVRPGHEPPRTGHASETTGDEFAPDVVICNAGSIEELRANALKEWSK